MSLNVNVTIPFQVRECLNNSQAGGTCNFVPENAIRASTKNGEAAVKQTKFKGINKVDISSVSKHQAALEASRPERGAAIQRSCVLESGFRASRTGSEYANDDGTTSSSEERPIHRSSPETGIEAAESSSSNASKEPNRTSRPEQYKILINNPISVQLEGDSRTLPTGATDLGEIHGILNSIRENLRMSYVQRAATLREMRNINHGVEQIIQALDNTSHRQKNSPQREHAASGPDTGVSRQPLDPFFIHMERDWPEYSPNFEHQNDFQPRVVTRPHHLSNFGRFGGLHNFSTQTDAIALEQGAEEDNRAAADPNFHFKHCACTVNAFKNCHKLKQGAQDFVQIKKARFDAPLE